MKDIKVLDRIPIASRLISFPIKYAFLIEAQGHGMMPKIRNKDLLICSKKIIDVKNGDIVICQNNKGYACKYYSKLSNRVLLTNGKHEFTKKERDFKLIGIVKQIIRTL